MKESRPQDAREGASVNRWRAAGPTKAAPSPPIPTTTPGPLAYSLTEEPRPGYQDTVLPVSLVKLTPSDEMLWLVLAKPLEE